MSIDYVFFDYREEHYAALLRAWLIAEKLSKNRNGKLQLTVYKAQQIDHILKNPKLFRKACDFLSGSNPNRNICEALYSLNITGKAFDKKEFLIKTMQLSQAGIVEIIKEDDQSLIRCLIPPPTSQLESQIHLESQIIAIKGLIQKSESVVDKIIMGD